MQDNYSQFLNTYITESFELLSNMEELLLEINEDDPSKDDLNAIFRCAHSIKGGAGAFNLARVTSFTHVLETLLDLYRDDKLKVTKDAIGVLLKSVDILNGLITSAKNNETVSSDVGIEVENKLKSFYENQGKNSSNNNVTPNNQPTINKVVESVKSDVNKQYLIKFLPNFDLFLSGNEPLILLSALAGLGKVNITANTEFIPPLDQIKVDNCYLSWEINLESTCETKDIYEVFEFVMDNCCIEVTNLVSNDKSINISQENNNTVTNEVSQNNSVENKEAQPVDNHAKNDVDKDHKLSGKKETNSKSTSITSIRVDVDKIDRLVNMVGELVISQSMFYAQAKKLPPELFDDFLKAIQELSQHSRDLQEAVMSVRMQPVKSLFSRMPRLVRDLSDQLGKDIKIDMFGEQTEIDKTVIEQLGDPLTHMIRNSADHGVEKPADRIAKGKPAQGTISLSASQRGGRIFIEIADDGAGIDGDRILAKAISKGLISKEDNLSKEESIRLIFLPGLSTAEVITNVSGRGVGMDVVKRNIESLGGNIDIKTEKGKGTTFSVSLPLTLAILDGMIVQVAQDQYIIPIANILETLLLKPNEMKEISKENFILNIRGEFIPLIFLSTIFGNNNQESNINGKKLVILVESAKEKFGLIVDELLGQQQVVIKTLEANSEPIDGISGATILGDGKVSLILDLQKIPLMYKKYLATVNPSSDQKILKTEI